MATRRARVLTAMPTSAAFRHPPQCVGEDGEATEGKPEERGHRAADYSEWEGDGAESPHT